jgi:non-heme chloroperoxidase
MPFFETPSGVSIHYESAGTGRPLVFVHGWSMSARVWRYQVESLASSYRVITLDLRGHGESSPAADGFSLDDFAEDGIALFDHLGLDNAILIGWSMGVQVALRCFARLADRLTALVLVGGTPRFTAGDDFPYGLRPEEAKGMAIRLRRNFTRTMGDFFAGMFAEGELDRATYQRIVRDIVIGGKLPLPEVVQKSLATLVATDLRPELHAITLPVLLVHGSRDGISLPDASRYMQRHLPAASLQVMEGAGHAPFLSRPEEFNSLLCQFVEEAYGLD